MKPDVLKKKIQVLQQQLSRLERAVDESRAHPATEAIDQLSSKLNEAGITAQRQQESSESRPKLKADHEHFGKALELVQDGHFVTDAKGMIQLANPAWARLINVPQPQLIDTPLAQFVTNDYQRKLQEQLHIIQEGAMELEWEIMLRPHGKPPAPAMCSMSALRGPGDGSLAIHWLVRDLTERTRGVAAETLLQHLGERVLEGLTLHQVLPLICEHLVRMFDYPFVWIGMKDRQGSIMVHALAGDHTHNLDTIRGQPIPGQEGQNPVRQAIDTGSIHVMRVDDPSWPEWAEWARSHGFQAGLSVPLSTRDEVLGALTVYASYVDAFDSAAVKWFKKLSSQVTLSLLVAKDQENLRLRGAALASAEHAVFITDREGRIEWINDAYSRLTGYSATELIGKIPPFLQSGKLKAAISQACQSGFRGQFWEDELVEQRKDRSQYTVEQMLTPLRNDEGHVTHFVAVHQDITDRKENEARIFHLAHHDPLTDLPNRVMFYDRLTQALAQARRHSRSVAVMFLDLDRLKLVNDALGHEMGDALLKIVANGLTHCVRATDTVARLSGDEFTLILQDLERGQDAGHVAQKVLDTVAQPIRLEGQTISVTASIGIAVYPADAMDPEALLSQADHAMYRAKGRGGNCYQFVSDDMNAHVFERLVLEKSVQRAWDRDELLLHFQPEIDLQTGQIVGMEALVRWQHPEIGLLFPAQFISVAKAFDCIEPIQEWVLREACRQCAQWRNDGLPPGSISVNLAMQEFDTHGLGETIQQVTTQTGLDPQHLKVEIPHAIVTTPTKSILAVIQRIRGLGVQIIVDEFQTGPSQADFVERLPIQGVKLGQALIAKLPQDHDAIARIKATVDWGLRSHLSVVAKGVESAEQVAILRELGCQAVQGYLCNRPLPADEMTTLLHGWWASEF